MTERLRFAPSPTGPLHIGGLRTALYNFLYAKKHNGQLILRVEDTDQKRYVEGAEDYIVAALQWIGIETDESPQQGGAYGPYRQSERQAIYKKHIEELIAAGKAYYAFDTAEELDTLREKAKNKGAIFTYNAEVRNQLKNSLSCSAEETAAFVAKGDYVIRLKIAPNQSVEFEDLLRGKIRVDSNTLDDKVLLKADGLPTYHFANVVDDHLMEITTVIRGEEWLPSLALHHLLYAAFGWTPPKFVHLPLILKSEGKGKLSKRDGALGGYPVFPLEWQGLQGFKETGFLPEAVRNFLVLIGWNSGAEKEVFNLEELIAAFDLSGLQKGGGRFDYKKALWMNEQYLQALKPSTLLEMGERFVEPLKNRFSPAEQLAIIALVQARISFLHQLKEATLCFHSAPEAYDATALNKVSSRLPVSFFDWCENQLPELVVSELKSALEEWATANNCGFGVLMQSLRLALVGTLTGPDVIAIIEFIGIEELSKRLRKLKEVFKQ